MATMHGDEQQKHSWSLEELAAAPDDGTPPGGLIDAGAGGSRLGVSDPSTILTTMPGPDGAQGTEQPASTEAQLEEH